MRVSLLLSFARTPRRGPRFITLKLTGPFSSILRGVGVAFSSCESGISDVISDPFQRLDSAN
jgi:hypothetical protein